MMRTIYAVAFVASLAGCAGPNAGEQLTKWEWVAVLLFGTIRQPWRTRPINPEPAGNQA